LGNWSWEDINGPVLDGAWLYFHSVQGLHEAFGGDTIMCILSVITVIVVMTKSFC